MTILAAFIAALIISLVFIPRYKSKGTSLTYLGVFFLFLFMAGIAAQFWVIPFGPVYWGISWLPLLFFILIMAFLFEAPSLHQSQIVKTANDAREDAAVETARNVFVWVVLVFLGAAILIGYLMNKKMNGGV